MDNDRDINIHIGTYGDRNRETGRDTGRDRDRNGDIDRCIVASLPMECAAYCDINKQLKTLCEINVWRLNPLLL